MKTKMNKLGVLLTITLAIMLYTTSAFAQSPEKMSYQAVVRNSSDALITNTQIGMEINIRKGSPSGTIVYTETQTPTTNTNGLVSIEIGGGAGFSAIDWGSDTYYIETKTAVVHPLTTYTITGVNQLLSVPYALHAKIADNITGAISETDPIFLASVASGISGADTTEWNLDNDPANELQQLSVSAIGDTLHLQNGGFVIIPGISAANPYSAGTVHCMGTPTAVVNVTNTTTGKTWMDRNLGASQVASSSTDAGSYGDLYQWGRRADGHQCRTSFTTNTLSLADQPGHGNFILVNSSPYDWRSPQNTNLWQGLSGVNNPCPNGYRLPTEAELEAERISWTSNNAAGAFASTLKWSLAGLRNDDTGSLSSIGIWGNYWSSTFSSGTHSRVWIFGGSNAYIGDSNRARGGSVRCVKD